MKNLILQKVGADTYQLGDRLLVGGEPIAIHPEVDKVGRQLTDDLMRSLDINAYEYAATAEINGERFRNWWAGEPGAQLTARDVYQIDQLNGQLTEGKIRDQQAQQQRQDQLRQEEQARIQEQNSTRQADYDRTRRWDTIYKNSPPDPRPQLQQLDSYTQARIADMKELTQRPVENEHEERQRDELTKALTEAGFF